MGTGDLFGDLGERRIGHSRIFEAIFSDRDGMSTAVPFSNKTCSWLEAQARRRANPTRCSQRRRYCSELAACRLTEPTAFDFLKPVTERKDKEVATDPRRITVVQSAPFETQFLKSERTEAIELALDRRCINADHG